MLMLLVLVGDLLEMKLYRFGLDSNTTKDI